MSTFNTNIFLYTSELWGIFHSPLCWWFSAKLVKYQRKSRILGQYTDCITVVVAPSPQRCVLQLTLFHAWIHLTFFFWIFLVPLCCHLTNKKCIYKRGFIRRTNRKIFFFTQYWNSVRSRRHSLADHQQKDNKCQQNGRLQVNLVSRLNGQEEPEERDEEDEKARRN